MPCVTRHLGKMMMSQFTTSTPKAVLPQTHSNPCTLSTVWWVYIPDEHMNEGLCCLRQAPLPLEPQSVTMQTVNQPALSETENNIKVIRQCILNVDRKIKKIVTLYNWIYLDASWYAAHMIHYYYSTSCLFKKQPWHTLWRPLSIRSSWPEEPSSSLLGEWEKDTSVHSLDGWCWERQVRMMVHPWHWKFQFVAAVALHLWYTTFPSLTLS